MAGFISFSNRTAAQRILQGQEVFVTMDIVVYSIGIFFKWFHLNSVALSFAMVIFFHTFE